MINPNTKEVKKEKKTNIQDKKKKEQKNEKKKMKEKNFGVYTKIKNEVVNLDHKYVKCHICTY